MGDDFLQDAWSAAIWSAGGDLEKASELWESAVRAARASSTGVDEATAAQATKIDRLNRLKRSIDARLNSGDVGSTGGYRQILDDLDNLDNELAAARARGDDAKTIAGLEDEIEKIQALTENARVHVGLYADDYDDLVRQRAQVRKQLEEAGHEMKALRAPKDRRPIEQWWQEFYHQWGKRLGLDRNPDGTPYTAGGDHPFLTGEKNLDWGPCCR